MNRKNKYIILIIFLVFLYLPTIIYFFSRDEIKITDENIDNSVFTPVLSFKGISEFPSKYEKFYNKNLPLKKQFINLYGTLNYGIFNESIDKSVLVGNNNGDTWFFYNNAGDGDPISYIDGRLHFDKKARNDNINKVKEQTSILKNKNIDLYYMIIPNKSSIYSEYLPKTINVANDSFYDFYQYMCDNKVNNLYYPYDFLKEQKDKNELYYRTDSHWNQYGTYIVLKRFLNKIYHNDYLKDNKVTFLFNDKRHNDLYNLMGLTQKVYDNDFQVKYNNTNTHSNIEECELPNKCKKYEFDDNSIIHHEPQKDNKVEVYTNDKYKLNETVMLIGDSYTTNMIKPLTSIYKKVVRIYVNATNYDESMIDKYKPNKIFYVRVERNSFRGLSFNFYNKN